MIDRSDFQLSIPEIASPFCCCGCIGLLIGIGLTLLIVKLAL